MPGLAGTGDAQALDTRETQAADSGGGAIATGGDQLDDVTLIDTVANSQTLSSVPGTHTGLVRATVG